MNKFHVFFVCLKLFCSTPLQNYRSCANPRVGWLKIWVEVNFIEYFPFTATLLRRVLWASCFFEWKCPTGDAFIFFSDWLSLLLWLRACVCVRERGSGATHSARLNFSVRVLRPQNTRRRRRKISNLYAWILHRRHYSRERRRGRRKDNAHAQQVRKT